MDSKCKGCTDRYVGCHAQCADYKRFRNELDEKKQQIRNAKEKDKEYREHKDKQVRKAMRYKGYG